MLTDPWWLVVLLGGLWFLVLLGGLLGIRFAVVLVFERTERREVIKRRDVGDS